MSTMKREDQTVKLTRIPSRGRIEAFSPASGVIASQNVRKALHTLAIQKRVEEAER